MSFTWGRGVFSVARLGRHVVVRGARFGKAPGRPRTRLIVAVTAVAAVAAGIGMYTLTSGGAPSGGPGGSGGATLRGPFRVMSVTPAPGSRRASGGLPVKVTFSAPLARQSRLPSVTPKVAGRWQARGDTMVFTPARPFSPSTQVTVTIPASVRSAAGRSLAAPMTAHYTTGAYATLRLAEMLGQLGYLPVSWRLPDLGMRVVGEFDSSSVGLASQQALAYDPPSGDFSWIKGYPSMLASLWKPDTYNVILKGAVMAFQSEHNMTINGAVTSTLWAAVFRASAAGDGNVHGYTYAVADQADPETLTIYHDGHVALSSPANTGIPASPTVNGTFPVYEKFLNTIMSGTNPDGSRYSDPVQYVSYFNGGDAVHYFPRGGYGYQQSLGCVELPYSAAERAYPYLTYGSLVTVTG